MDNESVLAEVWTRVVAATEPPGMRVLMQRQGNLICIDGSIARVSINSRPLFKMAQGRVEHLEAAFETVLGQEMQVSLEFLSDAVP
jgi:DNA polymerase-3 subunit gamma/tau